MATTEQIEQRAAEVLRDAGLFSVPVDPVLLAHRLGINVFNAKFAESSISGMLARRGTNITMLVNQTDAIVRKRFTVAHELGHHFLHPGQTEVIDRQSNILSDQFRGSELPEEWTPERRREFEANRFAAALLMPRDLIREAYEQDRDIPKLARFFQVSEDAMIIRLNTMGLGSNGRQP